MGVTERYCRFCGSSDLVGATRKIEEGSPALSVQIGAGGPSVGGMVSPRDLRGVTYPTSLCRTCQEVDADGGERPFTADVETAELTVVLPSELCRALRSFGASTEEVRKFVSAVGLKAMHRLEKFAGVGVNPCRGKHVGFKTRVGLGDRTLTVHLIFELNPAFRGGRAARVAYGGGNAPCR